MSDTTGARDVSERSGLPSDVRNVLLTPPREAWPEHPNIDGKAAFFLNYHQYLRELSLHMRRDFEALLSQPSDHETNSAGAARVEQSVQRLVYYANRHHRIEDANYFPYFVRRFPTLKPAFELLDRDHRAVSCRLDELSRAFRDPSHRFDRASAGLAYDRALDLDRILERHLSDEEEIIIPAFLQTHGV